ncbi:ATP-binding protein [Methanolobus sp. WCC4]|uniref:sensor histidine kinase n=1 Tax=Methanolobus sp. WCC4 TaxID=3125784 RepID=UPI0030FBF459
MKKEPMVRNMKIPGVVNTVFLLVVCILGFVLLAPFVIEASTSSIIISSVLIGCAFIAIIFASNHIEKKNKELENNIEELENKRIELEHLVERNAKIEDMISSLVSMFIQPNDTDAIIHKTLERTGTLCNTGNSYLYLFKQNGAAYMSHQWKSEKHADRTSVFERKAVSHLSWIRAKLDRRQIIVLTENEESEERTGKEQDLLRSNGLKSIFIIPVGSNEELKGFISLENYSVGVDHCQDYTHTLKVVSELVGMALNHRSFLKDLSLFKDLINRSNDFIFVIDLENTNIIDVNQTACQELGHTREEFLNMNEQDIQNLFNDNFWCNDLQEMFGDRYLEPNKTLTRKDNSTLPVELNVTFSNLDHHNYALAIVRDITKRKDIESILEKTKEVMELALDGADLGMWDWNLRTDEVMYNDRWASMAGYELENIEQNINSWRELTHPDDLEMLNANIDNHLKGETPLFESEFRMKNNEGKWQWILARGKLTEWDKNNEPFRFTGTTMDLDERKRFEEELRHSNELKDLFTDIMRHDLLNPAGNVKGFSDVLLEMEQEQTKTHIIKTMQRSIDKLIEMIDSAATFAKLESAEELELSRMDIMMMLKNASEQFYQHLREKNMDLEIRARGNYPAMLNPIVEEIFANFISNAIKYSPENTKVILDIEDHYDEWKVKVIDSGEGIPDESKPLVFDRFKRVHKKGVKGTGLGLAIVKKIAELLGGSVGIEDNPEGQGSVFWVRLKKAYADEHQNDIHNEPDEISCNDTFANNDQAVMNDC